MAWAVAEMRRMSDQHAYSAKHSLGDHQYKRGPTQFLCQRTLIRCGHPNRQHQRHDGHQRGKHTMRVFEANTAY